MTDSEFLKALGITRSSTLSKTRYFCEISGKTINLELDKVTYYEIAQDFFKRGVDQGIIEGKKQRSTDIMQLLNNVDIDEY